MTDTGTNFYPMSDTGTNLNPMADTETKNFENKVWKKN